jgi:hypothetical protein
MAAADVPNPVSGRWQRAFGEDRHAKPIDEPAQIGDAGRRRAGPRYGALAA